MVSRSLQRMIHVGCRQLGIDGETRRDLQLVVTGKDSMADMDDADLQKMLEALKQRGFKTGFKADSKGRHPVARRADVRMIHALWGALGRAGKLKVPGRAGLNAFIRARFEKKWGAVPIDVDALVEWAQISDVIDALKDWCAREGVPLK